MGNVRLILASASPRRRELLSAAGFDFFIETSNVPEDENPLGNPCEMSLGNALSKARAVAAKNIGALVLGADTVVALEKRVFNKPKNLEEAREMLRALSGREHTVFTGVALVRLGSKNCGNGVPVSDDFCETRSVACHVKFKRLDNATISRYFAHVNPLDKAGAYGIQEARDLIVESWDEPMSNIVGLPVEIIAPRIRELLKKFRGNET